MKPAHSQEEVHRLGRWIWGKRPLRTLGRILFLVAIVGVLFGWILKPVKVVGHSMEPICYDGEIGFINALAYVRHTPHRGDIVVVRNSAREILIKRIIALPGERIAFHSGTVSINGEALAEPYLESKGAWEWPEEELGEDAFFVTGDNRQISQQLRLRRSDIIGKFVRWHR